MKTLKSIISASLLLLFITTTAQNKIETKKGYSQNIGVVVTMLEDLKTRVTSSVQSLSLEDTDFLLDAKANRIGAMIYHLAATERYYQLYTFENRSFNTEEAKKWSVALNLGDNGRKELVGKPIQYYLDLWEDVRKETLRLLKTKDDKWFNAMVKGSSMNNHWAWYHVMEHQANHMGQIRLIAKRTSN